MLPGECMALQHFASESLPGVKVKVSCDLHTEGRNQHPVTKQKCSLNRMRTGAACVQVLEILS